MLFSRTDFGLIMRIGVAVIGIGATGCAGEAPVDKLPRQPVAGTVLIDGRPLHRGSILFFPRYHVITNSSLAAAGVIQNGRFSIPWARGLVPGEYRVAISAAGAHTEHDPPKADPTKLELVANESIPVRFNTETELAVEVKLGGIKHMKIEIDSK